MSRTWPRRSISERLLSRPFWLFAHASEKIITWYQWFAVAGQINAPSVWPDQDPWVSLVSDHVKSPT